ncbi:MAG: RNA polymerase sigma factor [Catenulispora sp.]|nr:RNA polymerase sigma factor [Catenulispora sp.]
MRSTEFRDFYEYERPRTETFLITLGISRQDAEDATHEAFAEGWRMLTDAPEDWEKVESHRAWIRTVAYRRFVRPPGPRQQPRTVATSHEDLPHPIAQDLGHAELTVQTLFVLDQLACLADRSACAVIVLDIEGYSSAEIADILEVGEQRVRDLRKKARAHLKKHLAQPPMPPERSELDD